MAKEVGQGDKSTVLLLTLKCYICIAQGRRELSGLEMKSAGNKIYVKRKAKVKVKQSHYRP
jgi:hypothetical protein